MGGTVTSIHVQLGEKVKTGGLYPIHVSRFLDVGFLSLVKG